MNAAKIQKEIDKFETKIYEALKSKYRSEDPLVQKDLVDKNLLVRWDLRNFYKTYLASRVYPEARLKRAIFYLFDIKTQLYYLEEVEIGGYNRLVYGQGYDNKSIPNYPHIQLIKHSIDQNVIFKSRILWERIMNFIYYLETGEELENKVSGKKSKKSLFFEFIQNTKWEFLTHYKKDYLDWFDDALRTPEVHKSSVLRKAFMGTQDIDPNKILGLINLAMNVFWENTSNIIQGKGPAPGYGDAAMEKLPTLPSPKQ